MRAFGRNAAGDAAAEARLDHALTRLAVADSVLAADRSGQGLALFQGGDRRRRPLHRLSRADVAALIAAGALAQIGEGAYRLTEAGLARARRAAAAPEEQFRAQHDAVGPRTAIDSDGDIRTVRGVDPRGPLARMARMREPNGAPFFSNQEIAAGARLRADWSIGQIGLIKGSDWTAPPGGSGPRRAPNAADRANAQALDARMRVERALTGLAEPLARIVRAVCCQDEGIEGVERRCGWPARSGKVALKLGLAQLADVYRRR